MDINKNLTNELEGLDLIWKERNDSFKNFLKTLITIASGLLALIISLKSDKSETDLQVLLFIVTIISTAIGIFSGVIVLFSDVSLLSKKSDKKIDHILELLKNQNYKQTQFDIITTPIIYKIFEVLCLSSLLISLISLTTYAVLISL